MIYRNLARSGRTRLTVDHRYSHLQISLSDSSVDTAGVEELSRQILATAYLHLDEHARRHPEFIRSLAPLPFRPAAPIIRQMLQAARAAGVGPMAAVAGALAEAVGDGLQEFCPDVLVENGGDLHIHCARPCQVEVYPGWGEFSAGLLLSIPPGRWGVASSSGRYGHSFSQGKAELVTVVTSSAALADAFATGIANRVVSGCAPAEILKDYHFLNAVAIIWRGGLWYEGELDLHLRP